MLDYKREYERWLASDALNADEKAELQAIAGDEKEIESRFYGRWNSVPPDCGAP